MRNLVVVVLLSCLLVACSGSLGMDDISEPSPKKFSPIRRIITTPKPDNVPLIGPPSTDLW